MTRLQALVRLALLAALLGGCQSGGSEGGNPVKGAAEEVFTGLTAGLPGLVWPAEIQAVEEREGYLDTFLQGEKHSIRLLFPPSESCRALIEIGATVNYSKEGTFGQVRREGMGVCRGVGTFALQELRDAGGKSTGLRGPGRPRARASYRVLGSDEEFAFLRGRFPLAGLVGIAGGADIEAWIPNADPCRDLTTRQTASMEYREHGDPLVLITNQGDCGIQALAVPLRTR